ncbi:unnamed protein product [Paramecium octaurelia]|uniref:Uncharacterized protein n=1 Tax=Paramecium octaurelia TaxID=43137 RepID=A0A8S1SKT3_PAROT|nr:unnamed protein product [Paramecium octaurelia]
MVQSSFHQKNLSLKCHNINHQSNTWIFWSSFYIYLIYYLRCVDYQSGNQPNSLREPVKFIYNNTNEKFVHQLTMCSTSLQLRINIKTL